MHRTAGLILLLALSLKCALAAEPAAPLSLNDAYALAVRQSEDLAIGLSDWRAAEARYRQSVGAMWPEARAEASALWQDQPRASERSSDQYRLGLGASYAIFNGFRRVREADARQAEGRAYYLDVERERQLLYQDVADVFYAVLAHEYELQALDEEIDALDLRATELTRRMELGKSRRAELLSTQVQLADTRVTVAQVNGLLDATRELLAFLTGVAAADLRIAETNAMPGPAAVEQILARANGDRPDIAAAATRAEAAQLDVKAAGGERNVQVGVDGNVYPLRSPDDESEWDVALRAELPLFDHGVRRAQVAERAEFAQARELAQARLSREKDRDVRVASRDFTSALAQWSAMQHAITLARENHDLQVRDFEMGRTSNLDVLVALLQLQTLRRSEAVLEMQVRAALVHLAVAAGTETP